VWAKLTGDGVPLSVSGYCYAKLAQHQEEAEGFLTEVRIGLCCHVGRPAAMPVAAHGRSSRKGLLQRRRQLGFAGASVG
jgi:hypothetical protein